jgi:hypothetical protein
MASITPEESAALAAAAATLRTSSRAAFERDVMVLMGRGLSLADAIEICSGIVPANERGERAEAP